MIILKQLLRNSVWREGHGAVWTWNWTSGLHKRRIKSSEEMYCKSQFRYLVCKKRSWVFTDMPQLQSTTMSILTLTSNTTLHAGRTSPDGNSFLLEIEWTSGLLNAERSAGSLEISKKPTRSQTRYLPSCDPIPEPNAPTLAPETQNCNLRRTAWS